MENETMEIKKDDEMEVEVMPAVEEDATTVDPALAGFIGGAIATGLILGTRALIGKIRRSRKAKKAAKAAEAENTENESE